MVENFNLTFPCNISATTEEHVTVNVTDHVEGCREDSRAEKTLKVVAYSIILLVSLVGNALIILIFSKNKPLRRSINYFVVNMAASDLFTPLTIMPVTIAKTVTGSQAFLVDTPLLLGNILCKLSYFLPDVSLLVSIESLLLISVDRLVAVVFPLKINVISSKVRLICILCTWIVAISVHVPYFYTFRLTPEGNSYICMLDWGADHVQTHRNFLTAIFITFFLVPVCVLAIVYGTIAWTLKRRHNERKKMSTCSGSRAYQNNRQIMRLSVAILTTFVVCIGPVFVFLFIRIFVWNWRVPPLCAFQTVIPFVVYFVLHSWSAINPCICFMFSKSFRSALKQILHYRSRRSSTSRSWMITFTHISKKRGRRSRADHISLTVIEDQDEKQEEEGEEQEQGQRQEKSRELNEPINKKGYDDNNVVE